MVLINSACEAIKAAPKYAKEHVLEVAGYVVVTTIVTAATLKCFGKSKAAAAFGIISTAFLFRDKICLIYNTCRHTKTVALCVTAFAIPFLGTLFAFPAAAILSWSLVKHQMGQIATIYNLENVNRDLKQNGESLNKRLQAYEELPTALEGLIKSQAGNNLDLATLFDSIKQNTSRLEVFAGKEESVALYLSSTLKQICTLMEQIEKQNVVQDSGADVRNIFKKIEETQNQLPILGQTIKDTNQQMNQASSRLIDLNRRFEAVVSVLEQENASLPSGGK